MIPEFVTRDAGTGRVPEAAERGTAADLLRRGQAAARRGEAARAARLLRATLIADPANAEARLWLAALAEDPEESLRLLTRVLRDEPNHPRAVAGLRWACERLESRAAARQAPQPPPTADLQPLPEPAQPGWARAARLLVVVICVVGIVAAGFLLASYNWVEAEPPSSAPASELTPAGPGDPQMVELPSLYDTPTAPAPTQSPEMAALPTDTVTATPLPTATALPSSTPTATPSPTQTATATPLPTATATPEPTATQQVGEEGTDPAEPVTEEKWIEVDIGEQLLIAWEGDVEARRMLVSTGIAWYPTVTGRYRIYYKVLSQTMRGTDYYLPNVPHVMFFYRGFAVHGTYWHSSFGTPMSHGCVNLAPEDAEWLFSWAGPELPAGQWGVLATEDNPGTLVVIHE